MKLITLNIEHKYLSAQYLKLFLFLIYSIIFLPHAFILNEDISLALAFEVDPGSLMHGINDLFNYPYYNMFNSYHFRHYGWAYGSINFFFLLPFKIIFFIFNVESAFLINFLIRFVFYLIGLFSIFCLFRVCKKILTEESILISFVIVNLYIFGPFYRLFYFLHPETTGILFTFLAIIYILDYNKKSKIKFYYYSFVCLALAILSKQAFFFSSFPLSILLFYLFFQKNFSLSLSNDFIGAKVREIIKIFYICLGVLFIIHPYAFFFPLKFLASQVGLSTSFASGANVNFLNSMLAWINLFKSSYYFLIPFTLSLINFFIIFFIRKEYIFEKVFNLILILSVILTIIFFAIANKLNIDFNYFQVIIPIAFIQLLLFLKIIFQFNFATQMKFRKLFTVILLIFIITNINPTIENSQKRLSYKESAPYKTYEYINLHLNISDKIANDHHVAIPSALESIQCHYWRGCNSYEKIVSFNPNYVAFADPLPVWGWSDNPEGKALKKYVEDKKMKLIKKIGNKNSDSYILIYKSVN